MKRRQKQGPLLNRAGPLNIPGSQSTLIRGVVATSIPARNPVPRARMGWIRRTQIHAHRELQPIYLRMLIKHAVNVVIIWKKVDVVGVIGGLNTVTAVCILVTHTRL